MICILDESNQIINIVNTDTILKDDERPFYPWNQLWEQYTDVEPFDYAKNRYINAAGAEFARRRDEIRWVDGYGFDCAAEDITNFMAAFTPLLVAKAGTVLYKVWTSETEKAVVERSYEQLLEVYNTVRTEQMEAYAWYEDIKAKLLAVAEAEGKEKLEAIFTLGVS